MTCDVLAGSRATRTASGVEIVRRFVIEPTGDPQDQIDNALDDPAIPPFGDPHKKRGDIFVNAIAAEMDSETKFINVDVTYGPPDTENAVSGGEDDAAPLDVEMDFSTITEQTFRDINGDKMVVGYSGLGARQTDTITGVNSEGDTVTTPVSGLTITKQTTGLVEVERPQLTVTVQKNFTSFPLALGIKFTGAVNAQEWSGFPAKTWLCRGIRVRKDGALFRVSFAFAYNEESWQVVVTTSDNGLIPPEVEEGNGETRFDVYKSFNFDELGVVLPS